MKAIIQRIIMDILALEKPLDPRLVHNIFRRYPEFKPTEVPTEHEDIWAQLSVIQQLAHEGIKTSTLRDELKSRNTQYFEYQQRSETLQEALKEQEKKITACSEALTGLFTNFLLDVNVNIAQYAPDVPLLEQQTGTTEEIVAKQLVIVIEQDKRLSALQERQKIYAAQIKCLKLKVQLAELITELNNLGLICNTQSEDWFTDLVISLADELEELNTLQPKLETLQIEYAKQLSTTEIQVKAEELTQCCKAITTGLMALDQEINEHSLGAEEIKYWTELVQQGSNINELISIEQSKIDTASSWSPMAWANWAIDLEYDAKQQMHINTVAFLNLLKTQCEQQEKLKEMQTQLTSLETLLAGGVTEQHVAVDSLITETLTLINTSPAAKFANPLELNSASNASDFYLHLLAHIALVAQKIEQKKTTKDLLSKQIALRGDLNQILGEYHFRDQDLPINDMKVIIDRAPQEEEQKRQIEEVENHLALSKKYQALIKSTFIELYKTKTDMIGEIKFIREILQTEDENQAIPLKEQIDKLSDQLSIIQEDMWQKTHSIDTKALSIEHAEHDDNKKVDQNNKAVNEGAEDAVTEAAVKQKALLTKSDSKQVCAQEVQVHTADQLINNALLDDRKDVAHIALMEEQQQRVDEVRETTIETGSSDASNVQVVAQETLTLGQAQAQTIKAAAGDSHQAEAALIEHTTQQKFTLNMEGANADITDGETNSNTSERVQGNTASTTTTGEDIEQIPPNRKEREQLQKWHELNNIAIEHYPMVLKEWYLALYSLAEEATKRTPYSYKFSHIIKDISFELQQEKSIETLLAYQKICPDPKADQSKLLALKPNVPIVEIASDEEYELAESLHKLYAHYKKLKRDYTFEAALLLEIIQTLSTVKKMNLKASDDTVKEIPAIIHDPRYEPLKRHRGFLKIWELLENFFRLLLGKIMGQEEREYAKKPCFFKTHALELVEQAELEIRSECIAAERC